MMMFDLKRSIVWFLTLVLFSPLTAQIKFLPQPQEVRYSSGFLNLESATVTYSFQHKATVEDHAAVLQIRKFWDSFNILKTQEGYGGKAVIQAGVFSKAKRFAKNFDSRDISKIGEQGYVLNVTDKKIFVGANTHQGLFYGIQTLSQLLTQCQSLSVPQMKIVDWPTLKIRAWQDDISRGPIPTLDFLKSQVKQLAGYKLNALTLYTEHVFQLEKHPHIAPPYGLTKEELGDLIEFSKKYYVDVIGNFQSFGHFYHTLKLPEYAHLAETPHVLTPAKEETYEFLKEVYGEVIPAYESEYFNINCDETFGLGTGPAKAMLENQTVGEIYASHINRVVEIIKPYNKKVMMWGDIALNHREILTKIPKDLIMLSWGYHPGESFESAVTPFKDYGFEFMVCPGVSGWNRIWPDIPSAMINIKNYVRDGIKHGAIGMINTTWDDNGYSLFNNFWPPLIWGAECAWNPVTDEEVENRTKNFKQAIDFLYYEQSENSVIETYLEFSQLVNNPLLRQTNHSLTWASLVPNEQGTDLGPILELKNKLNDLKARSKSLAMLVKSSNLSYNNYLLAIEWIEFVLNQMELQVMINQHMNKQKHSKEQIQEKIDEVRIELLKLRSKYVDRWKDENRLGYLDQNLGNFDRHLEHIIQLGDQIAIHLNNDPMSTLQVVSLNTLFEGSEIYYTLDGTESDSNDTFYQTPIYLEKTSVIKAKVKNEDRWGPQFEFPVYVHDGKVKELSFSNPFSPKYRANGAVSLVDKKLGSTNYTDGNWLGFEEKDLEVVMTLARLSNLSRLEVSFLQNTHSWIFFPTEVELEISEDGTNYESMGSQSISGKNRREGTHREKVTFTFNKPIKYIKIKAKNIGKNPTWHPSAGAKAWLFVDEVTIQE